MLSDFSDPDLDEELRDGWLDEQVEERPVTTMLTTDEAGERQQGDIIMIGQRGVTMSAPSPDRKYFTQKVMNTIMPKNRWVSSLTPHGGKLFVSGGKSVSFPNVTFFHLYSNVELDREKTNLKSLR